MSIEAALISLFNSLPGPSEIEPIEERKARIVTISQAVALETPPYLIPLVSKTIWDESGRLRKDVHSGKKLGDFGRASCLGQLHSQRLVPKAEWRTLTGIDLESTRRCIRATTRLYSYLADRCGTLSWGTLADTWTRWAVAYGTGKGCSEKYWAGARPRAESAVRWKIILDNHVANQS